MKIQNILFPKADLCTTQSLYFRRSGPTIYNYVNQSVTLNQGGVCSLDTYFNSFSIGKWYKYTILDNLKIKLEICGDFLVTVFHKEIINRNVFTHMINVYEVHSDLKSEVIYDIPLKYYAGMYYVHIQALKDDSIFYGGSYETDVNEEELPNINLALDICTYKKEEYIHKNLEQLNCDVIQNTKSVLHNHLSVFVVDNGQTLTAETIENEYIHLFPNRNIGGTGGFTRGLVEILDHGTEFSHVIITDDDIVFETDSFVRTYTLLRLLRPEFRGHSVGGSTLRLRSKHIQHTSGDRWNGGLGMQGNVKGSYDLSKVDKVLQNEIEEATQYNAWTFSCVPLDAVRKVGLPLPIFIHRDDIEYGLRLNCPLIHLNGICIWHDFYVRYPGIYEYYDMRNLLITDAIHYPELSEKKVIRFIRKRMLKSLMQFRYKEPDLMFRGIEDFLKGIDWLKEHDAVELHNEISQGIYQPKPVEELPIPFHYGAYLTSLNCADRGIKKLKRWLRMNGWIGRSKKTAYAPLIHSRPIQFDRAHNVLQYNPHDNTAIITQKSYQEMFRVLRKYLKIRRMIYKKMYYVSHEYRERYGEVISTDFWGKYLQLDSRELKFTLENLQQKPEVERQTVRKRFLNKYFPGFYKKIDAWMHPYPFSYRAAWDIHLRIVGCAIMRKLHLDFLNPRMRKIRKAHNRHEKDRCFIVGSGPSLRVSDVEALENEYTFAMNSIFLLFNQTKWRPTYYLFMDSGAYKEFSRTYDMNPGEYSKCEAYLSAKIKPEKQTGKERYCLINFGNHTKHRMLTRKMKQSKDISVSVYDQFTVTNMAIELAMYMGFKEIYLLGIDCNYDPKGKMHFIENSLDDIYRKSPGKIRMRNMNVGYMQEAYKQMEGYSKEHGVKIYNATRGGKLEAFERVDFDSLHLKVRE